ncbi:hypothetical protein DH2020_014769 [Rehmannia glutinosa]|uniref:Uncharacterized protein n=1 Tax=Rehmannia glutinosa TaxID=99300 RepID=A0ABR0X0W2_REHGL
MASNNTSLPSGNICSSREMHIYVEHVSDEGSDEGSEEGGQGSNVGRDDIGEGDICGDDIGEGDVDELFDGDGTENLEKDDSGSNHSGEEDLVFNEGDLDEFMVYDEEDRGESYPVFNPNTTLFLRWEWCLALSRI